MSRLPKPPANAVALTAFRELPDGRARQYTETWTPADPWQGCEHFIRMCGAVGYLRESTPEHAYAVLDAISANGDILATYDIPHARAFRFIYRKLHLRVAETDGEAGRVSKSPTPQAISALLRKAGFERSESRSTRIRGWRESTTGYHVTGYGNEVIVAHRNEVDHGEAKRDRMLGEYAEAIRAAGWQVGGPGAVSRELTVTAPKED